MPINQIEEIYYDPDISEILGVFKNGLHIKLSECIIIVPIREYNRIQRLWLREKRNFCERYNHYCGVGGYFIPIEPQFLTDTQINEWSESDEDMREVTYPVYYIKKFEDMCDMEHG